LRLVVAGGRAQEKPGGSGAVAVGVRTLSEGGAVGSFSREQVELFCVGNLINCVLEADEEFLCMDFRFTLRDGGMRATFQLLHMVLEHNVWLEDALDRAKQLYLSHYHAMPKSLERATAHRLMRAMFNGEERFIEPSPQAIEKLTLPVVREAVMQQLVPSNMEVCVVGDFSEEEVESCLLDYLGTLTVNTNDRILKSAEVAEKPVLIDTFSTPEQRHQRVRILSSEQSYLLPSFFS
jgi:predicted Zn-dependent peptidase